MILTAAAVESLVYGWSVFDLKFDVHGVIFHPSTIKGPKMPYKHGIMEYHRMLIVGHPINLSWHYRDRTFNTCLAWTQNPN
jgi:hypothetical protein